MRRFAGRRYFEDDDPPTWAMVVGILVLLGLGLVAWALLIPPVHP